MIIHPLLVAVYPILFFYTHNQSQLRIDVLREPLGISLLFFGVIWAMASLVFRKISKGSIFASYVAFVFFSYGHISGNLKGLYLPLSGGLVIGPDKVLMPLVFLMTIFFAAWLLKTRSSLAGINRFVNITLILLVSFQVLLILPRESRLRKQEAGAHGDQTLVDAPDIYFIILDAYARGDTLEKLYGYNNESWLKSLEEMGFTVDRQARSNYTQTFLSLSATLNLDHVNYFENKLGKSSKDVSLPFEMIHNSGVVGFLKERGYKIINFSSGWGPTDNLAGADVNFQGGSLFKIGNKEIRFNEYYLVFLQTTALSPFVKEKLANEARDKVLYTLEKLKDIPYQRGNKFVLAHFNVPHPPYLFDENGNALDGQDLKMAGEEYQDRENYLKQLRFISTQIRATIKAIHDRSAREPIIILQADHGPSSVLGHPYKWPRPASPEGIKERIYILSAYHLPDHTDKITASTPVNYFRWIFNRYFNADYQILPERSYFSDYKNIYEFFDVTQTAEEGWD